MRRILKFGGMGLAGALALTYMVDWARVVFPGNRTLYEDLRVDQLYTDTNKYSELEYSRGTPVIERCVYALFPHAGFKPCWYLEKHTINVTNTD